jgi:hypothetical protein
VRYTAGVSWRVVLAAVAAILIGSGLVATGWVLDDSNQFLPALLLELGAAFFLVVPLVVLERLLEGRIREARDTVRDEVGSVRREVRETARRLDDLDGLYRERQDEARAADRSALEAAHGDVTFENVHEVLRRARQQRAISTRGVQVPLDHVTDRMRFRLVYGEAPEDRDSGPMIWIDLVDATGFSSHVDVIWSPAEAVEDVWQRLVEGAQRNNRYPGDGILVPGRVIGRLLETARRALEVKTSPRGSIDLGPVVEFVGDWAITDQGLEHASEPACSIPSDRLLTDEHLDDSMLEKTWIDKRTYLDAAGAARGYHERLARDQPPRLGEP